eukprot:2517881-Prymnesium_polylepis.1
MVPTCCDGANVLPGAGTRAAQAAHLGRQGRGLAGRRLRAAAVSLGEGYGARHGARAYPCGKWQSAAPWQSRSAM